MVKEKDIEFIDPKIESKELEGKKTTLLKDLIDGTILTRQVMSNQLPFIIFLSMMAGTYIGNRYHAEKVIRDMAKLQVEVKELRAQAITTASELMFISKQSEVVKMVKENQLGLEESLEPPYKIKK
jgi:hypothetical protein